MKLTTKTTKIENLFTRLTTYSIFKKAYLKFDTFLALVPNIQTEILFNSYTQTTVLKENKNSCYELIVKV